MLKVVNLTKAYKYAVQVPEQAFAVGINPYNIMLNKNSADNLLSL